MKQLSIIITILFLVLAWNPCTHNDYRKRVIVEDKDLQFVSGWVKSNITDGKSSERKIYMAELWNKNNLTLIVKECKLYDIPPSVVLSQMFIESRHRSEYRVADFVIKTNNYFGIMYKDFKEVKTIRYTVYTREYTKSGKRFRCRRSFSSFSSFKDCLTAYLVVVSRYKTKDNSWKVWKHKMIRDYASDPSYSFLVNKVVEVNHLEQFDTYVKRTI